MIRPQDSCCYYPIYCKYVNYVILYKNIVTFLKLIHGKFILFKKVII
jgi:hypothetical protein